MSTHVINQAFGIAARRGLWLSQPAVCRSPESFSVAGSVYRAPNRLLRYVAFVEIMVGGWVGGCSSTSSTGICSRTAWLTLHARLAAQAPIFAMDKFREVIQPTLEGAYTGWGELPR